ncbi:MAG: hypothetical protein ACFWUL_06450 [Dialister sp.]
MKKARGLKSGFPVFLSARCGKNPGNPPDIEYRLNRPSPIRPNGSMRPSSEIETEINSGFAANPLDLDLGLDPHTMLRNPDSGK